MQPEYERETVSDLDDKTDDQRAARQRVSLHSRIVIALVAGAVLGGAGHAVFAERAAGFTWIVNHLTDPLGQAFLRLLLMIVVPLVFSSLTVGVAGIGDVRKLGRVGVKSFAYTTVISVISVLIGLTLANVLQPGRRVAAETRDALMARYAPQSPAPTASSGTDTPLGAVVRSVIPTNPLESAARPTPDMLGLMFFALMVGLALTLLGRSSADPVLRFLTSLYEAMAKLIDLIMKFAPIGVFCLLFTLTARFGFDLLAGLGWFVATVLLGLSIHMFIVYSVALRLLARISPLEFFRRVRTVILTAFSTSSSNATLPTTLRVSEVNLGVPRDIGGFVLTIGATANQNGTALYEGVTVLFLAQLAGVELSLGQQLLLVYLALLGGIGTAGVPSGSIPFIMAILPTVGVNSALIGVIIGVDRILDMCRTTLNVIGDMTAAAYVARSEGAELLPRLS